jgi:hypothetical protein
MNDWVVAACQWLAAGELATRYSVLFPRHLLLAFFGKQTPRAQAL